jgi:hypothetical protein
MLIQRYACHRRDRLGAVSRDRTEPVIDPMPEHADPGAADSTLRCGTCANMTRDGWCRLRQFTVTPALPACEFYEPVPASRFPGT